jgi:hypothetical protein
MEDSPKQRAIVICQQWFDAEVVVLAFDLSEGPIELHH